MIYILLVVSAFAIGMILEYEAMKATLTDKIQILEQQSEELCQRCGWRFFVPGVLGQGKDACYNCDCEEIAAYRQSDQFSNLGRK